MFLPKPRLLPQLFVPGLALACLGLGGCAEDKLDDEVAEDTGEAGDTGETGDAGETGDTGEIEEERSPALGIQMTQVEANQGTAVIIGEGGGWVPAEQRLGPLIRNRDTLVRVHYTVDDGWIPREIEARFIVEFADGTRETLSQTRMVEGDSEANSLGGSFFFGLVGDDGQVAPGSKFQVELHEVDEGAAATGAGLSEGLWQTPPQPELIGIQPEPMELKIVFVPYHHQYENIDRVADTSEANMKVIVDHLYEQNPAEELIWEVHEPVLWDLPMENLGAVLGPLAAMRDNELAFPNVYYHALFPVTGGGIAGVAGVAQVPGDGKGEATERVSVTALGPNVGGAAGTVVHEVGHNEGLNHVYCPFAEAASPDPTYPYENGLLGQWGFGIVNFTLHGPTNTYDYMSYCGPSWVSTWSWRNTFERIRTLTSWDYEDLGEDPFADDRPLLFASFAADGSEFWWVGHGTLPQTSDPYGEIYGDTLELRSGGVGVAELPTVIRYANDYSTHWQISELPPEYEDLQGIDEIAQIGAGEVRVIPAARVQLSQRPKIAAP